MPSTARSRLLGTAHVERGQLAWWVALRSLVVYQVLVLALLLTGNEVLALPVAVGVLFASLAESGEDVGRRWRTMLWATLWISITTYIGGIASNQIAVSVAMATLIGLVAGAAGMLGPRAALGGVLALVTYTIFNGAPVSERTSLESALGMALGGVAVTVVMVASHAVTRTSWLRAATPVESLRQRATGQVNSRNDFVRHGVRLAVVIGLATLISDLTSYPHDYWIPMTVAWVSKPDMDGTARKIIARIAGTVVGVMIAAFLVDGVDLGPTALAVWAGLGLALAVLFAQANYAVAVVGVTFLVVGLFTFDGDPVAETLVLRLVLTAIAGMMAFLGYYIWPPYRERPPAP